MPRFAPEVLLAPDAPTPMTHLRGSVLFNSLGVMRARHLEEAYWPALPPETRAAVESLVVQSWVPVELALPHYQVMDTLIRSPEDHRRIGIESSQRLQNSYLKTLVKLLRVSGTFSVERGLGRLRDVFDRMMRGGTTSVTKTGPKDVEVRVGDVPLVDLPYFRNSLGGWLECSVGLLTHALTVEARPGPEPATATYHLAWV